MSVRGLKTRRIAVGVAGVLAVLALAAAPAASAAVEYGTTCAAFESPFQPMMIQVERVTGEATETSAPGVVTAWKVREGNIPARSEKLKVLKVVGGELEVVAESAAENVLAKTLNEFDARIPVPAGVRFGGYSSAGAPHCRGVDGDKSAYFTSEPALGSKAPPTGSYVEVVTALAVVVEPDADGDGFGDESQDQCPQDASAQGPCPVITPLPTGGGSGSNGGGSGSGAAGSPPGAGSSSPPPGALALSLRSRLEGNVVTVRLTSSLQAPVTVTAALKGRKVAGPRTVIVLPGQTGRLYLHLPRAVRRSLAALPRKRRLHLVLEATAATSGTTASVSTEQALPGRKPPHHHRHPHPHRSAVP